MFASRCASIYFFSHCAHSIDIATGENPAVNAYDAYVKSALVPLALTCDNLGGLANTGKLLLEAWEGVRTVIVLASRSKAPSEELGIALAPHLIQTQNAVKNIRALRLDRKWDSHAKAIVEMLSCLSWILYRVPKGLPSSVVKESLGSAEFWSNRIRKDYKGKDDTQIAFCDAIKKTITELTDYVEEYHKTGLTFNARGVSLAEAAIVMSDEPVQDVDPTKSPIHKRHPTLGAVVGGGNQASLIGELGKRKNADGTSAATGLKHVSAPIFSRSPRS
jgi:adenylyl cyclase-associated protein